MKLKYILLTIVVLFGVTTRAQEINYSSWMSQLPDTTKVRNVSIPGTHDAATSSLSGGLSGGKAQTYTIGEQWEKGVRAFDLRPREDMKIYHTYDTGVTMEDVFKTIQGKLEANPSEFAIFIIRFERDNPGENLTTKWKAEMEKLVNTYDGIIAEFSPSIRVKEARGKIIVLTRNEFPSDKVAFLQDWAHWPTLGEIQDHYVTTKLGRSRIKIYVQDKFEYDNVTTVKQKVAEDLLKWTSENAYYPIWIINHASGYKPSLFGLGATPQFETNAKTMNPFFIEKMDSKNRVGIIMMDFAGDNNYYGQDLVDAVISQNWKYLPPVVTYSIGQDNALLAWNPEGVVFKDLVTLSPDVDPANITVTLEPGDDAEWITDESGLPEEFEDAKWAEWKSMEDKGLNVDGFWNPELVEAALSEGSDSYTISATLPCSGIYKVTLSSNDYYLVPEEGTPYFLTVYPSVMNVWTDEEGGEYSLHIKGVHLDEDNILRYPVLEDGTVWEYEGLGNVELRIPGVYLAEVHTMVNKTGNEGRRVAQIERHENSSALDLSGLANEDGMQSNVSHQVSVVLVKNGATTPVETDGSSREQFSVETDSNADVPTDVEAIAADRDTDIEVFTISGLKVGSATEGLQPGLYIIRRGNESSKILVK